MANTMDKLRELGERMVARSQHCENTKDAIAMQEHAAELDAILRESEAPVPAAATLDDAAADPALTLDVARELLRDAAAGIRQLAARATPRTEPAEGREAVAQVAKCAGIGDRPIFLWTYPGGLHGFLGDHPVGTKLYTTPPAGDGARELHAHLLDMLGAKDHEDAARIIAQHHVREIQACDGAPQPTHSKEAAR